MKKTRKRIDRFIEDALKEFASWFSKSEWIGKERDCVNIFVANHLMPAVNPDAAITDFSQIHIEGNIPQIATRSKNAVSKDLVVWRKKDQVTWNSDWRAVNVPRVVIEWKVRRRSFTQKFDKHDINWLEEFTSEFPTVFGYAISVEFNKPMRKVHIAKVCHGEVVRTISVPN